MEEIRRKMEEKMFVKIEDAVQLLNREYMQSLCISKEDRAAGIQKIKEGAPLHN